MVSGPASAETADAGMRIEVFTSFAAAEAAWRAAESATSRYAFQCFDWLAAWHRTLGSGVRPVLVSVTDGDRRPLVFLPLGIERRLGAIDVLVLLGGVVTDYHAPLVADGLGEGGQEPRPLGAGADDDRAALDAAGLRPASEQETEDDPKADQEREPAREPDHEPAAREQIARLHEEADHDQRRENGRPGEDQAAELAEQLAEALEAVERGHVEHDDLERHRHADGERVEPGQRIALRPEIELERGDRGDDRERGIEHAHDPGDDLGRHRPFIGWRERIGGKDRRVPGASCVRVRARQNPEAVERDDVVVGRAGFAS